MLLRSDLEITTNLSEVLLEFHATAVTRLPRILEDILCRVDFLQLFPIFLTQIRWKTETVDDLQIKMTTWRPIF